MWSSTLRSGLPWYPGLPHDTSTILNNPGYAVDYAVIAYLVCNLASRKTIVVYRQESSIIENVRSR